MSNDIKEKLSESDQLSAKSAGAAAGTGGDDRPTLEFGQTRPNTMFEKMIESKTKMTTEK